MNWKEKITKELVDFKGRVGVAIEIENERYEFHSEEVFPSASVIKVPILMECLKQSEHGNIDVDEFIKITERTGGSGVIQALSTNLSLTIKDLMTLMITVSDNTATNMLIDFVGMDPINRTMEELELHTTRLQRKMMDFAAKEKGLDNVTSPSDMVKCLKIIHEGDFLSANSRRMALDILHFQQFHDKLLAMIDTDKVFTANKTGSLPNVENDCAILKVGSKTAYVAILTDKLSDPYEARQVISRIGKHIYHEITRKAEAT
ncbi:serine hydrolase [Bacillus thermocopriae]|uniref:Serine hydrolase n=1 Tax=Neobacillus thermocopriae TaxID=1215031 RepID=A0A6B3TMH9_9BACI|nr:serine hydrolase [Neobacillus thermocopriae]NEX78145.1 serine hydrolase [Neobacillus thermocopriae]